MKTAPAWVDRTLYPFTSHWLKVEENELHYIDEGQGEVLLFVHGTPEWFSIGKAMSSGCIRLINQDVMDLYSRTDVGAKVIVR